METRKRKMKLPPSEITEALYLEESVNFSRYLRNHPHGLVIYKKAKSSRGEETYKFTKDVSAFFDTIIATYENPETVRLICHKTLIDFINECRLKPGERIYFNYGMHSFFQNHFIENNNSETLNK